MSIVATKLLYLVMMCAVLVSAYAVDKSKSQSRRYAFVIILVLSLIAGLRGESVGVDTWVYKSIFESNNGKIAYLYGVTEPIFVYISSVIMTLTGNAWPVFLFWSVVTNAFIVSRMYELRYRCSFTISVAVYVLVYYFPTFNIMRQMVAVAIVFYATKWLEGRQSILKYVVAVIVASMIHYSAAISLVYIPIYLYFKKNHLSRAKKILLLLLVLSVPVIFFGVYYLFVSQYVGYLSAGISGTSAGLMIPLKLCIMLCIIVWERCRASVKLHQDQIAEYRVHKVAYFVGLAGFMFSYFWQYADRVVYYFVIFETACYGIWLKHHRRNDVIRLMIIMVLCVYFVSTYLLGGEGSGQGQYPYYFFWME